jgi:hypothetical protein
MLPVCEHLALAGVCEFLQVMIGRSMCMTQHEPPLHMLININRLWRLSTDLGNEKQREGLDYLLSASSRALCDLTISHPTAIAN